MAARTAGRPGRSAEPADPPDGVLDPRSRRSPGPARPAAHRPAAPGHRPPPRRPGHRDLRPGALPGPGPPGPRTPLHVLHGGARPPRRAARPTRSGRRQRARRGGLRAHRGTHGRPGRLLRQHPGPAHRPLRRPDLPPGARPGPPGRPGRLRPPGPAVRPPGRGPQPQPLPRPPSAVPGPARLREPGLRAAGLRCHPGVPAAGGRSTCREGGPDVPAHRTPGAAPADRLPRIRHRPLRTGHGRGDPGPAEPPARRSRHRPGPAGRGHRPAHPGRARTDRRRTGRRPRPGHHPPAIPRRPGRPHPGRARRRLRRHDADLRRTAHASGRTRRTAGRGGRGPRRHRRGRHAPLPGLRRRDPRRPQDGLRLPPRGPRTARRARRGHAGRGEARLRADRAGHTRGGPGPDRRTGRCAAPRIPRVRHPHLRIHRAPQGSCRPARCDRQPAAVDAGRVSPQGGRPGAAQDARRIRRIGVGAVLAAARGRRDGRGRTR